MVNPKDYWLNLADADLGAAHDLLKSGRYMFVLFFCQQAAEKTLKALVCVVTEGTPQRTHNLISLALSANLDLDDDREKLLKRLTYFYIQSRYPEEISALGAQINKMEAKSILKQTGELVSWLKSLLP